MPEPDPQPPQPRPVSAARWLSLLTPSAFTIAVPLVMSALGKLSMSLRIADPLGLLCLNLFVGILLCFVFGFFFEKWRWGTFQNGPRALGCGVLILIVNGIISFAGCSVITNVFNL